MIVSWLCQRASDGYHLQPWLAPFGHSGVSRPNALQLEAATSRLAPKDYALRQNNQLILMRY